MSIITDILKEIPLSTVLRERLTHAEGKMAVLEKQSAKKDILLAEKDVLLRDRDAKIQALELDLKKAQEEIDRLRQPPNDPVIAG
jgi:hypothetical protein